MKKFIATLALVLFTVVLTSYNNNDNGDDQIAGDTNSTQMQEPGGAVIVDF